MSNTDADLTGKFYRNSPILMDEQTNINPWSARLVRVFDINKREVAEQTRSLERLQADGFKMDNHGRFLKDDIVYLPVIESKLMHQYNHRFASYEDCSSEDRRRGLPQQINIENLLDTRFFPLPRHWLPRDAFPPAMTFLRNLNWFIGYRNFARSTDERTVISTFLPFTATDFPMRVMVTNKSATENSLLLATLNSMPLDYVARQKIGGTDISSFIFKQLPVPPPDAFSATDIAFIVPRVLELVYTAWDMRPFAEDVWNETMNDEGRTMSRPAAEALQAEIVRRNLECNRDAPRDLFPLPAGLAEQDMSSFIALRSSFGLPPFRWSDERRALIRAELDARIARLYGLTRDELRYILDPADVYGPDFPGETFRVLKEKEIKQLGEYRTRRLVLEAWDREEAGPAIHE